MRNVILILLLMLTSSTVSAQTSGLMLSEVHAGEGWVELVNAGTVTIDTGAYFLCKFPTYAPVQGLDVVAGSRMLEPGEYVAVAFDALPSSNGEVGLYVPGTFDFSNADNMIDYMEYGSGNHTREPLAVSNGFWESGAFVTTPPAGQSMARASFSIFGPNNWEAMSPSPGAPNGIVTSVDDNNALPSDISISPVYPNPVRDAASFDVHIPRTESVHITLHDMLGREIKLLHSGAVSAERTFRVDMTGLAGGMYWVALEGESFNKVLPLVRLN
ncbi:MAG: hypothetical protein COV99_02130 [Bacteroidetes bacterium CG12_big_fil_rev_8_21_14_0_65_60_17]|nr:MAG: hypothetical protein COV99_02130 [Bacteroidetes bacterium CG12_big_fil_rev_8_21_14_0_65_60_17]